MAGWTRKIAEFIYPPWWPTQCVEYPPAETSWDSIVSTGSDQCLDETISLSKRELRTSIWMEHPELMAFMALQVNSLYKMKARRFFYLYRSPGGSSNYDLSLIHISEPTRLLSISYGVFCL